MAEAGAQTKTQSSSILVRLGDKEWELHEAGHQERQMSRVAVDFRSTGTVDKPISLESLRRSTVAPAIPPTRRGRQKGKHRTVLTGFYRLTAELATYVLRTIFPKQARGSLASLKGGLLVGMVFGCLAMFLFHQMGPVDTVAVQDATSTTTNMVSTSAVTVPRTMLSVPSFQTYAVNFGSYSSLGEAQAEVAMLKKRRIPAVIVPIQGFQVVSSVAVHQEDAAVEAKSAKGSGLNPVVKPLASHTRQIPVLGTSDKGALQETEAWLSESSSAILALTAWLSDNGRIEDAQLALSNALKDYPGDSVIAQTGISDQLAKLQASLVAANAALKAHQKEAAMQHVIASLGQLASLSGMNA
ncbi:SPOR domain-containing protein [Alicyclobacillus dauci]|uniref:SPOR domain-containing protein n=1 Tax=Alicyclobacillus dauci TaxID=1475485 RepID=A0ABY6Z8R6_9BACL|nr:hypothetical protein [Alicyclobacillus dauci]WAH38962.1 hypothetical protein NZD86_11020 [Alicyclobacillus dauci]